MSTNIIDLAGQLAEVHAIDTTAAARAVETYARQLGADVDNLSSEDADHIRRALAAEMSHDTGSPLDRIMAATVGRQEAEDEWRAAIRDAVAAGQRVVDIADAADISRERVYQIRDGRR